MTDSEPLIRLLDAARASIPPCLICASAGLDSRMSIVGPHPPIPPYHTIKRADQTWDQAVRIDCPRTDEQITLLKLLDEIEGHDDPDYQILTFTEEERRERALRYIRQGI